MIYVKFSMLFSDLDIFDVLIWELIINIWIKSISWCYKCLKLQANLFYSVTNYHLIRILAESGHTDDSTAGQPFVFEMSPAARAPIVSAPKNLITKFINQDLPRRRNTLNTKKAPLLQEKAISRNNLLLLVTALGEGWKSNAIIFQMATTVQRKLFGSQFGEFSCRQLSRVINNSEIENLLQLRRYGP